MNDEESSKKNETNNKAIVSVIFGILSIVIPFIGLILGVIGIIFSRKATIEIIQTNQNGRILATLSMICSVIGIVIQLLGTIGLLSFMSIR